MSSSLAYHMIASRTAKNYGIVLKRLRLENSISQEKLAFKCNLHPTYISLLERSERQPSLSVFCDISTALNLRPSEFMKLLESE